MTLDRQQGTEDALGAATEQLRAAIEREAAEVMNRARAEAAGIEEAANRKADEIEREARERALTIESGRLTELMDRVDALEGRMQELIDELRDQLREAVAAPTETEQRDPIGQPTTTEPSVPVEWPEPPGSPVHAGGNSLNATEEAEAATERSPALDDLMHAQIVSMRDGGRTRAEAERFLSRFKSGASYVGLLDEVYPENEEAFTPDGSEGKRRIFKRRRI